MFLIRSGLVMLLSAILSHAASAQQPVRQSMPAAKPLTRDSIYKQSIEEQYDAEINKCRSQISTLNKEIIQLDKKIEDLEMAAAQAEKDLAAWKVNYDKSPGRKDPNAKMMKDYELQVKLNDIENQVNQCKADKKNKQLQIEKLKLHRAELEKEKQTLLNKLN